MKNVVGFTYWRPYEILGKTGAFWEVFGAFCLAQRSLGSRRRPVAIRWNYWSLTSLAHWKEAVVVGGLSGLGPAFTVWASPRTAFCNMRRSEEWQICLDRPWLRCGNGSCPGIISRTNPRRLRSPSTCQDEASALAA